MATVQTLFDSVLPRLRGVDAPMTTVVAAVNEVTEIIFDRLYKRSSDLVMTTLAASCPAGENAVILPENFRGLATRPYALATGKALLPTDETTERLLSAMSGPPTHFALAGDRLTILPHPDTDTVIGFKFYEFPDLVGGLNSETPFNGMFDRVYREGIAKAAVFGPIAVMDQAFRAFLIDAVDDTVAIRQRYAPVRRTINDF